MEAQQLIEALQEYIKTDPISAKYAVRVVEGIEERTSNEKHTPEVNYWVSHFEVRDSITEDPTNGEFIIYSNE